MSRPWLALLLLALAALCRAESLSLDVAINREVTTIYPQRQQRVEQALASLGYTVQWIDVPHSRGPRMLESGAVDGFFISHRANFHDSDFAVMVDEPLVTDEHYVYAITQAGCERYRSGEPQRFGGVQGVVFFELIEAELGIPLFYAPSVETLIRMLQADRLDATFANSAHIEGLQSGLGIELVRCDDQSLLTARYYLYLHARHRALAPTLAEALRNQAGPEH